MTESEGNHKNWLVALALGIIICVGAYSIYLYARSMYRKRDADSKIEIINKLKSTGYDISKESVSQVEQAVLSMKERISDE